MSDMVERVARAVCKAFAMDYHGLCEIDANFETDKEWENWIPEAQAAIAAMQADADIERIKRERDQAVEALREIDALDGEINPSNYDHDDACYLNRQFCYAGTIANQTLASIEGAGHE